VNEVLVENIGFGVLPRSGTERIGSDQEPVIGTRECVSECFLPMSNSQS